MKYLNMILFGMVACSSSVAQDAKIHEPLLAMADEEDSFEEEPEPPPLPEPKPFLPRKVERNSPLESEWLTKICVSEGGFNFTECEKILETLENMRDMRDDKSLLFSMYNQSARITRRKPFTDTRQIWISYLQMRGTEPPEKGWVECTGRDPETKKKIPKGCTGSWQATVKKWVSFREKIRELYYSGIVPDLVPGAPIQWGGDMDYWIGAGRNFCPLNEGSGMKNTYWGDPDDPENIDACLPIDPIKIEKSKTLSAEIASGRAMRKYRIPQLLGKNEDPLIPENKKEENNESTRID